MTWSIDLIGRPQDLAVEIEHQLRKLEGDARAEFAEVAPTLRALVELNQAPGSRRLVRLKGNGYVTREGSTIIDRYCVAGVEMLGARLAPIVLTLALALVLTSALEAGAAGDPPAAPILSEPPAAPIELVRGSSVACAQCRAGSCPCVPARGAERAVSIAAATSAADARPSANGLMTQPGESVIVGGPSVSPARSARHPLSVRDAGPMSAGSVTAGACASGACARDDRYTLEPAAEATEGTEGVRDPGASAVWTEYRTAKSRRGDRRLFRSGRCPSGCR